METYTNFDPVTLDLGRVRALAQLVMRCTAYGVELAQVRFFQHGWQVTFKGLDGDVILHDHSYGHEQYLWESYCFPWDYGDVSTHDTEEMVNLLHALKYGEDWKHYLE